MGEKLSKLPDDVPNISETESTTLVEAVSTTLPGSEAVDVLASYKDDSLYNPEKNEMKEREFHTEKKAMYWLPKDEEEQHRLTGQHFAIKELFEGNFLPEIHEVIDLKKGVSVLDVGCGSGVWIMDMFNDYPNCTYEGCDIADIAYKNVGMKHINYSFGNVVEGLKYADNTFDLVHMRLLVLALKKEEWPIVIKELLRVTKPGGVIQLVDANIETTGGPLARKFMEGSEFTGIKISRMICEMRGQDPYIASKLESMINDTDGCQIIKVKHGYPSAAGNSSLSKKFRWDFEKAAASIVPMLGHRMGLPTKEEQEQFLIDLHEDFLTIDGHFHFISIAVQKL